jgi:hypothetical protein
VLVRLVEDAAELFHDAEGRAYITVPVGDHHETYRLKSNQACAWSRKLYRDHTGGKSIGGQALQDALNDLEGTAQFGSTNDTRHGAEREVHVRLAENANSIYLDLGDDTWRVVEIDANGWRVLQDSPVKFRRPAGMLPLPMPVEGGSIDKLRRFVNIVPSDWPLFLGWLVCALNPRGPYPVLFLIAEQGSGKSTNARFARALFDPNQVPLRSEPRDPRDLFITASNSIVVMIDNASGISRWLSDGICRLATVGGLATPTLYENDEETIFQATRPVLVTGIEELAAQSDLLDRAIIVTCPRIPPGQRKTEKTMWSEFEEAQPALLGALLTAVSTGLRNLPETSLENNLRMADATLWVTACEPGLGLDSRAFFYAYRDNRAGANELALDVSPVPAELRALLEARGGRWTGTASELQAELDDRAGEKVTKQKVWPKSARALGNTLRRLAPNLREAGVELEFEREPHTRRRIVRINLSESVPSVPNVPGEQDHRSDTQSNSGTSSGTQNREAQGTSPQRPREGPEEKRVPDGVDPAAGDEGDDGDDGLRDRSSNGLPRPQDLPELLRRLAAGEFDGRRGERWDGIEVPNLGAALASTSEENQLRWLERYGSGS